jgi:putative membrane protein
VKIRVVPDGATRLRRRLRFAVLLVPHPRARSKDEISVPSSPTGARTESPNPVPAGADHALGPQAAGVAASTGARNGLLFALLALAAFIALNRHDLSKMGAVLASLPAAIAVAVVVHAVQVVLTGLAWRALLPRALRPSVALMIRLRWYRESAASLLPGGGVLGQAAAARLLARHGVPGEIAGATAVVDMTAEAGSQLVFTLVGLGFLLAAHRVAFTMEADAAAGVAVVAIGAVAIVIAQRHLPLRWLEAVMARLARRWSVLRPEWVGEFHRALLHLHAQPRAIGAALLWHGSAWLLGTVEIACVLSLLGQRINLADALIIESLAQALRNAGVMLPGALGVQEGAVVASAALVGVPPGVALTAALVRRSRDVVFGLPGLVAWQQSERAVAGRG